MGSSNEVRGDLTIDGELVSFVEREVLPGLAITPDRFWHGLASLGAAFGARNAELLARRRQLQEAIDAWHSQRPGARGQAYLDMLREIGYLVDDDAPLQVDAERLDAEITSIAGPQLVVPASNARYALNAANARWGSLYDALYGTDALGDLPPPGPYDAARGSRVVAWARTFLDEHLPLDGASHHGVTEYSVGDGQLRATCSSGVVGLRDADAFVGCTGDPAAPAEIYLAHHGLHVCVRVDRSSPVGAVDAAGVVDVELESAISTIIDLEDSVAAVDAADKVAAYRNWLGLMNGDLTSSFGRDGTIVERRLADDRWITGRDGSPRRLRARSLLLIRNVGLLMTTPAVTTRDGSEIFEGLLDALVSVAIGAHDLRRPPEDRNSPAGSVYVVKPKLHGPEEVAFTDEMFAMVEDVLGLPRHTVKLGIMDEERRTSANLAACLASAKSRVAFVNTGFLDRTGDEIHTSMAAGPMVPKAEMRQQPWIAAYEQRNVAVALRAGMGGRAQIGKGMWAAPDRMAALLEDKVGHPLAGASCAWVPSPTAATLHAVHYHRVDVWARQRELAAEPVLPIEQLLELPLAVETGWTPEQLQREVDNNLQGIVGYVVRWVDQGVGCSKVPDLDDVALMEDRATCRISAQHVANWLRHGVVDRAFVTASLRRMATVVDGQNASDPAYRPMGPTFDGPAFAAASALVFDGADQPSGYTEPILHRARLAAKASAAD